MNKEKMEQADVQEMTENNIPDGNHANLNSDTLDEELIKEIIGNLQFTEVENIQTFSDDNEFNPQVTLTTKNKSPLQLPIWDEIAGKKDQKPHKYFLIHFIVFKLMKQ